MPITAGGKRGRVINAPCSNKKKGGFLKLQPLFGTIAWGHSPARRAIHQPGPMPHPLDCPTHTRELVHTLREYVRSSQHLETSVLIIWPDTHPLSSKVHFLHHNPQIPRL